MEAFQQSIQSLEIQNKTTSKDWSDRLIMQAKENKDKLKSSLANFDWRQTQRSVQVSDFEVTQMRKQIRDMEVYTSQAKLSAERDKNELESILMLEKHRISKLEAINKQL